ncbi:hypothetical protein [Dyadobacter sp. CY312]|uniref:hypothetical protein n=1 Tax=Dyadobacter sp. CY312 TaxID=2907303 RepID=UPI001F2A75E2|nr:hypothetical protein [Dyadobacter sp. CY312]MCE7040643.1 hypothetical protein [Dyadobacter sp. CY312]
MKRNLLRTLLAMTIISGFTACDNDKEETVTPVTESEYKFIRILVNDELTRQISLVDPVKLTTESFEALYPKSALYNTQAGRFGALVNGANNHVQLFDTGFEGHGDHVDVKGTPKFGALTGNGNKPTHFKSKGDEIITFNDGDGTLSIAKESEFHVAGSKMTTINAGNKAHHGAMTKFDNGTYAITEKDESVAGTLPERVKIVDASGKTLFASTVQTKGLHGNATDGKISLFGSSSGILVVEPSGAQRLIPHPEKFGTAWFGSILEAKGANKFIGYSAAVGAYIIDVQANSVTPIVESTDLMQVKTDYAGNNLIAFFHNGEVRVYDLKSNAVKKSGSVIAAVAKDETQKPQIEATSKYLYVTQPKSGELLQIDINDFTKVKKVKVSATPYRLTILGIESDESH